MLKKIWVVFGALLIAGCISLDSVNAKFRDVDTVWLVDNQQFIGEHFPYNVNADFQTTFDALKQAFWDLNMPIDKESPEDGYFLSRNKAPSPLSAAQWEEVRQVENPRLKEIAGWMMKLPEKSVGYFVTVKAMVKSRGESAEVSFDYYMEMPEYEDMGLIPSKQVAPHALKLVSEMIIAKLDENVLAATN